MSNKLRELLERAETWPEEVQEEAAETLLSIEQSFTDGYVLTAEDREALARSAEDVRQGRFVRDSAVSEFFDRYRTI
ncbi:hypothetical protein XH91_32810 [Bradyrhizobium guangzhouense]|uniref:Uncharacterized protein n=1 Tax=Bradyrhizobium guangzhouense TaxID=1325095 RepID=A0AAE5X6V3_9BRAD|nr:hypothetical protein XH91_32810 [Bradyrhizobium guangzhouense]